MVIGIYISLTNGHWRTVQKPTENFPRFMIISETTSGNLKAGNPDKCGKIPSLIFGGYIHTYKYIYKGQQKYRMVAAATEVTRTRIIHLNRIKKS